MMNIEHITTWLESHPLSSIQIDCVTTVMLKILDGKCKMRSEEKIVMALLYEQIKNKQGHFLTTETHQLIADARNRCEENEDLKMLIYEKRLLAETTISRPVMKQFKSFIREQGLLNNLNEEDSES
jgi:hypothetical protein